MKMMKKALFVLLCFGYSLSAMAVNVNTASAAEIAKELKGIGSAEADPIVMYREEHGAFKNLKELTKVKGIGAATIDKNRENITLSAK